MTSWRIDPYGVAATLASVSVKAEELAIASSLIEAVSAEVHAGCADVPGVGSALDAVLQWQAESLDGAELRIVAAILGASSAAASYLRGDEEMAASTQAAAIAGDVRYFEVER